MWRKSEIQGSVILSSLCSSRTIFSFFGWKSFITWDRFSIRLACAHVSWAEVLKVSLGFNLCYPAFLLWKVLLSPPHPETVLFYFSLLYQNMHLSSIFILELATYFINVYKTYVQEVINACYLSLIYIRYIHIISENQPFNSDLSRKFKGNPDYISAISYWANHLYTGTNPIA